MNRFVVLVIALAALTAFVVWVASGIQTPASDNSTAAPAYGIALLVLLVSVFALGWRSTASQALRYALVCVAVGFALVLGFSYRNDLVGAWQRVAGGADAAPAQERTPDEVVLSKASDGHFYADVDVNGTTVRMLADTGASTVALSEADAESAGIDVDQLDYTFVVSTANGRAPAAEVHLDEVRVGSIVRNDVRGLVTRGLSGSLLGMSFFSTLSQVALESDELVLRD